MYIGVLMNSGRVMASQEVNIQFYFDWYYNVNNRVLTYNIKIGLKFFICYVNCNLFKICGTTVFNIMSHTARQLRDKRIIERSIIDKP